MLAFLKSDHYKSFHPLKGKLCPLAVTLRAPFTFIPYLPNDCGSKITDALSGTISFTVRELAVSFRSHILHPVPTTLR